MEISTKVQLIITVYAVIIGAGIGAIYDIIRITRVFSGVTKTARQQKFETLRLPLIGDYIGLRTLAGFSPTADGHRSRTLRFTSALYRNVSVLIGDIVFFFIVSPVFAVFIYYANSGKIRWYLISGALAGFVLYYFTVGRAVMLFSGAIVFIIKSLGSYVIFFTVRPVVIVLTAIFRAMKRAFASAVTAVKSVMLNKKMIRYTARMEKSVADMIKID
jgi:Spore cortex protein YabQ (Spore_YabQ).